MILGVLLVVIGFLMLVFLGLFWDRLGFGLFMMLCFVVGGAVLMSGPLTGPDYQKAPYSVTVEGQQFYFGDYDRHTEQKTTTVLGMLVMDFNEVIVIPSHFYKKVGFINSWEFCDTPMKIEIQYGSDLIIKNHTPKPKPVPYIVEKGCKNT